MPIYEYKCEDCGALDEIITNNRLETLCCEQCNGVMNVLVSAPAQFKFQGGAIFSHSDEKSRQHAAQDLLAQQKATGKMDLKEL